MTCKEARQMIVPYINDALTDKELEIFLGHTENCAECREELEIYYTIYTGLAQLDGGGDVGDIQGALDDALAVSHKRIRGRHILNFTYVLLQALAVISAGMVLVVEIMDFL